MEEAKTDAVAKTEEVTKTDDQADCCQSGVKVGGKQIGIKSILIGGGLFLLALALLTGNGSVIWGALPFLLILACPLMHIFMHGGKGHKH